MKTSTFNPTGHSGQTQCAPESIKSIGEWLPTLVGLKNFIG
jgi:hypothetical protein